MRSPGDQQCAKRESLWLAALRSSCMRCCETGRSSRRPKSPKSTRQEAESSSHEERRPREGANDGADFVARSQPMADCDFNQAALHPAHPIKRRTSAQRTQAPESVDTERASHLDPLENDIGRVEVWRGDVRLSMSVSAPFVWRCLSGSAVAPFPHPAHRTGQADFPHPALGQDLTPSFACDAIGSF